MRIRALWLFRSHIYEARRGANNLSSTNQFISTAHLIFTNDIGHEDGHADADGASQSSGLKARWNTHLSTVITSPKATSSLAQWMENPTNQTTTPQGPVLLWVEEPKVRGTLGILIFCLSTLIICVWSALHFNIPKSRQTKRDRLAFGAFWVIIAVSVLRDSLVLQYINVSTQAYLRDMLLSISHLKHRPTLDGLHESSSDFLGRQEKNL